MLFLLLYFLVYGGLNLACWKALAPLLPAAWMRWALAAFIGLMLLAPFAVRRLEHWGFMQPSRVWAFLAWHWMAIAFWLGLLVLPLLLWNGVAHWRAGEAARVINHQRAMAAIGCIVGALLAWGIAEAQMIRLHSVRITAPAGSGLKAPLRVAFISDVHLSLIRGDRLARTVARLIEEAHPDVILSGGDFLDGQALHLEQSASILARLQAPLGKWGVLGNHEWYTGLGEAQKTHEAAGIRLLRGEQVPLRADVLLAGSDDETGRGGRAGRAAFFHGAGEIPHFQDASTTAGPFVIYLHHQPLVPAPAAGKFDLMLSGHTHSGQIFPFGWLVRTRFPYMRGLFALPSGGQLYVSPGTGTWGPSLRVLARPEVTLLEITPAS